MPRTARTLREIPDSAFLSALDRAEDAIVAILSSSLRIFGGVTKASETKTAWDRFKEAIVAGLAVGGKAEDVIVKAARDAVKATNLLDDIGPGALAGLPIPGEITRAGLDRYTERQAKAYLATRAGSLVREIDQGTVTGLRHLLAGSGILESDPPKRILDAIGELVGLTEYQGKVFLNDLAKRRERGTIRTEGDVVKLWRKHIRRRAGLIVETEAAQAANAGIFAGYRALRDEAGLPVRGVDGVFLSDRGETSRGPQLHIRCKCVTRLVPFAGVYWVEWVTRIYGACPRCIAFDTKLKGWETEQIPAAPSPWGQPEGVVRREL